MYDTPPADELVWPAAAAHMAALIAKKDCDRAVFMSLAVKHCLPVYAVSSEIQMVMCRSSVDGCRYSVPIPEKRLCNLLLLPKQLQQLENGSGPVYVSDVVPSYEDPLHVDWSLVKKFRDGEIRVDHVYPAFNHGRWMGQSADMFLAEPVLIRDNYSLEVPRHTVDEVARLLIAGVGGRSIQPGGDDLSVGAERMLDTPLNHVLGVPVRGITKHQVIEVFQPMVKLNLEKALGNGKGLYGPDGARVQKGSMGRNQRHVGLWNPIILAVAFYEREGVPEFKLKQAFRNHDCLDEWGNEFADWCEQVL